MNKNHKNNNNNAGELDLLSVKPWKIKLERVAKGYVRATVHGDDVYSALNEWKELHKRLTEMGEKVEAVILEPELQAYRVKRIHGTRV